LFDNYSYIE